MSIVRRAPSRPTLSALRVGRMPLGPSEVLQRAVVARITAAEKSHVQSIICFGSQASGKANAESDIDILVLVNPPDENWGPHENIAERKRLESEIGALGVRLDLWVRTIDQYAEARGVIGSYEHAANTTGKVLWSRAVSRLPIVRLSPADIRYGSVTAWLELSRRLLGRSIQLSTVSYIREGRWLSPEHYAWRACMAAMGALFVWRQIELPSKYDDLPTWLDKIGAFEPNAAVRLEGVYGQVPLSAYLARAVLRSVAEYLSPDERLRLRMQKLELYLSQPVESLAAVPSLKQ